MSTEGLFGFRDTPGVNGPRLMMLAALAALPLTMAVPSHAQQAIQETPMSRAAAVVEEIIVTARRREESALDVPVALTVFSGEQLNRMGTADITELSNLVPNITVERTRGTNSTASAFIRGVGQQDPVAGFEQGVGIYIDDVYLNRPHGAVLNIYDVERIEVLRGPQGTLYGRNTIGGAIKYVTRRLSADPEVGVELRGGNYGQLDASGTFSFPLTESFRAGATLASFKRDGFGKNLTLGKENYNKDVLAGRASLEWLPRDDLFFRVAGDYTRDESEPRHGHRLLPSLLTQAPVLRNVYDSRPGLNVPDTEQKSRGIAGTAEWHINDTFTLRNVVAYRKNDAGWPNDFDALPTVDIDVPVIYRDDQFTEELQLLFDSERVSGVVGFFYMDASAMNEADIVLGATGALIGIPGLNAYMFGEVDTETWSLFGDATYRLTDTIEVSLGGRYTNDKRHARLLRQSYAGGFTQRFGGAARAPFATTTNFDDGATFTNFSPRVGISWRPAADQNLYLTLAQGFKGGGFDPRGSAAATPPGMTVNRFLRFDPEKVNTVEIGHKANWLEGRATTSAAVFHSIYDDIQIPGSIGVDTTGDGIADTFVGVTTNAGEATISGLEFEGLVYLANDVIRAGDSLSTNWALGYINAEFDEFINNVGVDISKEANFQNTPKWTAQFGFDYRTPLRLFAREGQLSLLPRAAYRSRTHQFEIASRHLDQEAFTLIDMSVIWTSQDRAWRLGVHGKNLTDKRYIVAGWDFVNDDTLAPLLGLERTLTAFYGDPRTISASISYAF
jgi:iron complex outermembrane recepter protein